MLVPPQAPVLPSLRVNLLHIIVICTQYLRKGCIFIEALRDSSFLSIVVLRDVILGPMNRGCSKSGFSRSEQRFADDSPSTTSSEHAKLPPSIRYHCPLRGRRRSTRGEARSISLCGSSERKGWQQKRRRRLKMRWRRRRWRWRRAHTDEVEAEGEQGSTRVDRAEGDKLEELSRAQKACWLHRAQGVRQPVDVCFI